MRTEVVAEIRAIYEEHGVVDPHVVVQKAENPETALHGCFIWDNTKAGHEYRLYQARKLLAEVTVIYPDQKEHRVWVSPVESRGRGRGYVALVDVLSDKQRRARFLAQALVEYERLGREYEDLQELAGVREAVRKASEKRRRRRPPGNGIGVRG